MHAYLAVCMYIHTYVYIYMHACLAVCMHARYACMHTWLYACTYIHMYTYICKWSRAIVVCTCIPPGLHAWTTIALLYLHIYVYICMCTDMHTHMYVCMYVLLQRGFTYIYIGAYADICSTKQVHTYICIHIHVYISACMYVCTTIAIARLYLLHANICKWLSTCFVLLYASE
jgi:hypothetical protein